MNRNETRWVNDYSHFMEEYVEEVDAEHHGIKRQKHGVRRFQNYDGSYTDLGRARYGIGESTKMSGGVAGGFSSSEKEEQHEIEKKKDELEQRRKELAQTNNARDRASIEYEIRRLQRDIEARKKRLSSLKKVADLDAKMDGMYDGEFLSHHGVKDMKWYHRRWQYPDGSLTPAGREHYGVGPPRTVDPDHPITSRIAKAAQDYKERRAIAKIREEKDARVAKLKAGKEAAKIKRTSRFQEVRSMTRTPEELVKNRDKLTDEEYKAAVEKFETLKRQQEEDERVLKKYSGIKAEDPQYSMGENGELIKTDRTKERDEEVKALTLTAEDLVANRDKLTKDEFAAAKARLTEEKRIRDEDEEILNTLKVTTKTNPWRAEKLREVAGSWSGKKLMENRGQFTKEEFDKLKIEVASRSLDNMRELDTVLDNSEFKTAYDNYYNRTGKVKVQKANEAKARRENITSLLDTAYKTVDTASKVSTGRSIQDLAKATLGRNIMDAMETVNYETAQANKYRAQDAQKVAAAMVDAMDDVLKRAKNLDDETYVKNLTAYYEILMRQQGGGNQKKKGGGKK